MYLVMIMRTLATSTHTAGSVYGECGVISPPLARLLQVRDFIKGATVDASPSISYLGKFRGQGFGGTCRSHRPALHTA